MSGDAGGITRRGFLAGAAALAAALPGPARAVPPSAHRRVLLLPQGLADHGALAGLVARERAAGLGRPLVIAAAMPAALRRGPALSRVSPASLLAVPPSALLRLVHDAPPGTAAAIVTAPTPGRPTPAPRAVAEALGRLLADGNAPATTILVHAGDREGPRDTERAIQDALCIGLGSAGAGTQIVAIELAGDDAPVLRPLPRPIA